MEDYLSRVFAGLGGRQRRFVVLALIVVPYALATIIVAKSNYIAPMITSAA